MKNSNLPAAYDIYIAGKITGKNYDSCFSKFEKFERECLAKGISCINPMKIVKKNTEWINAMKICISELVKCNYIYFFSDWIDSKGSRLEYNISKNLNIKILHQVNFNWKEFTN